MAKAPARTSIPKRLNDKQRAFIEFYLVSWNATDAARRAAYAEPNVQGPRLLVNVSVRAEIDARLKAMSMSADEVLARLTQQASANLAEFISLRKEKSDNDKERVVGYLDVRKVKRSPLAHLIKKVNLKEGSIELHDPQAALALLGKHHRLFTDRVELVDWRSEVQDAGVNPGELFEDLVQQYAQALSKGRGTASG